MVQVLVVRVDIGVVIYEAMIPPDFICSNGTGHLDVGRLKFDI